MIYKLQNGKVIKTQIKNTAPENPSKWYMAEGGRLFEDGGDEDKTRNNKLKSWLTDKAVDYFYNTTFKPAIKKYGIDEVRLRLYDNVEPFGYENAQSRIDYAINKKPLSNFDRENYLGSEKDSGVNRHRDDIWRTYLNVDKKYSHYDDDYGHKVIESKYKPTNSRENKKYYTITHDDYNGIYAGGRKGKLVNEALFGNPVSIGAIKHGENRLSDVLGLYFGTHTISRGMDPKKGDYVSFYDLWDIAPSEGNKRTGRKDESRGIGTPIEFYDRIYLDDYFGVDSRPKNPDEFYGGYITPTVFTENKKADGGKIHIGPKNRDKLFKDGGVIKGQTGLRTKPAIQFIPKQYNPNEPLNWDAENWLSERAENDRGEKYTQEDIDIFNSHVPEYKKIEADSRANGTFLQMSDGSKWTGDPRDWVLMQSEAFKKNYDDKVWYTGQAEWPTTVNINGTDVNTDKVRRARFHNGQLWFSDDPGYAQLFADEIDSKGANSRYYQKGKEDNIDGMIFNAAIPKNADVHSLEAPAEGTHDYWKNMPFTLEENTITRLPTSKVPTRPDGRNIAAPLLTDDIVNHAQSLGWKGLYMYNVDDGAPFRNVFTETKDHRLEMLPYKHERGSKPENVRTSSGTTVNEFISLPGLTEKLKFIHGNNGDFNPNKEDKYSSLLEETNPNLVKRGGTIKLQNGKVMKRGDKDGIKRTMALIASGRATQALAETAKNVGSHKAFVQNAVANKLTESSKELASAVDDAKGVLAYQKDYTAEGLAKSMDHMASLMGKMPEPMKKRALETGMRVSSGGTPSNAMREYKYYGDPIKDAIYITTGIGSPSAKRYSGVVDSEDLLTPEKYRDAIRPDIIDAIVYGKEVNPVIGAQVDSPEGDYGIETDYIKRTYPDRKVQYIETEPPVNLVNQNGIESRGIIPVSFSGSFNTSIPDLVINNQGFVGEYGTRNDSTFVRGFDVYDFASNPGDRSGYKGKWGFTSSGTENPSNALIDIVNAKTTPLVIRTPWVPVDRIEDIVTDINMNPNGKSFEDLPDVVDSIFRTTRANKQSSGKKKLEDGGIIKLQNAGSVPQVDNTRVSKPLMKYQTSTVEQDHDALVKWNLEHPNDKVYRIEDLIQKEKEANPSWVKRAANLAVNPIPTSNFGMMSVPNPNSPVRSTVKDELGVAMTAASIPMIGSELGIYGGLGAGLRFGAGSAVAAGTSYIGGKAGDWLDDKLGTNWIGDTNRLVLPFITFPVGMKGANNVLRSAAGHGITMGMPQETFGALRGQYFNNKFANTGNRYFGTNFNKLYKQAISDVYGYDKFINDNVNVSSIQATSKNGVNRLIHWDKNSTGAPTDPIKHVHWEDGKITPAKTKIYVKGEPGVSFTVVEGDQHPIFWGGNKAWWEGPNGNTLDQHFGDIEFFKKRHSVQLPDLKQNFVQTNPTTKNGRFLIIDNPDQQLFRFNHYTGSTTGAISPSTLTDTFEYNPLTKTWARVKYVTPNWADSLPDGKTLSITRIPAYSGTQTAQSNFGTRVNHLIELANQRDSVYGGIKLIRNIDGMPMMENGKVRLIPQDNVVGNFTTDLPFRTHANYSTLPGTTYMLIDPNVMTGIRPISIEPMDTMFFNPDIPLVEPNKITLISGDPAILSEANKLGFKIGTNDAIKNAWQAINAVETPKPEFIPGTQIQISKGIEPTIPNKLMHADGKLVEAYKDAVDKYITENIGRPTLSDYRNIEQRTGLNAGVAPEIDSISQLMANYKLQHTPARLLPSEFFTFPNGNTVNPYMFQSTKSPYSPKWFQHVYYQTAPPTEANLFQRWGTNPHRQLYGDVEEWRTRFEDLFKELKIKGFKQGGIIKGQDGIEELPVQKSSTNVVQKPIPRRALSPVESVWEEANHDPNLYEYQPYDDPYVKEFFEQDVLPRYMRENPNASQEEINAVRSAYTNKQIMSSNMESNFGGLTDADKFYAYGIPINPSRRVEYNSDYKLSRPIMVHENTHAYRQGLLGHIGEGKHTVPYRRILPPILGFGGGSGYTNKEVDYLQNGYDLSGFDFSEYGSEENQKFARLIESGTTNAEIRYRLWRELYDNLGKVPTLEETDEFIKNYDKSKLWSLINNASAYGQKAYHNMIWNAINSSQELPENHTDQDEINLRNETESQAGDRLKDALIHVADNNQKTDMTNIAKEGLKIRFKNKLYN